MLAGTLFVELAAFFGELRTLLANPVPRKALSADKIVLGLL